MKRRGFTIVEVALVVAILVVLGGLTFWALRARQNKTSNVTHISTPSSVSSVAPVKSTEDLDANIKALDSTDSQDLNAITADQRQIDADAADL